MTDFAAVAEDIYRRKESLFNTGNLGKNIERLTKNNQPASQAIVEIAENIKIIADGHRADDIFIPEVKRARSINDIQRIRAKIEDLSKDAKNKVEDVIETKEKTFKQARFEEIEKANETKYKRQINDAKTSSEIESILAKAERDTQPETYSKIDSVAENKLRDLTRREEKEKRIAEEKENKLKAELERKEEARRIQREGQARKEAARELQREIEREEMRIAEQIAREQNE